MSQENVELIVRALEAYRAGGFAAGRGFLHPDFEMVRAGVQFTEAGTYRGYDAASESMLDYIGTFEDYRAEPEEFIDAGDHVVVAQTELGRARDSSVELREIVALLVQCGGRSFEPAPDGRRIHSGYVPHRSAGVCTGASHNSVSSSSSSSSVIDAPAISRLVM